MAYIESRINRAGQKTYRVRVRLKGHPELTKSFKTDLAGAKRWALKVEDDIRLGKFMEAPDASRKTLSDAIERYSTYQLGLPEDERLKTIDDRIQQLGWWEKHYGSLFLVRITPQVVAEARDKLRQTISAKGTRYSPSSVNRYLAALSHLFTTARYEWQWCSKNPVQSVKKCKEPRGRVRFLSEDERIRLLEATRVSSSELLHVVVLIAISTGMRKSEILSLRFTDVDTKRESIIIQDSKNGERRSVPLVGPARDALFELMETTYKSWLSKVTDVTRDIGDYYIFSHNGSKPMDIRRAWTTAVSRAGLKNFRFHDLRHTAASNLAMNGATTFEIATLLGHKTLSMVKRYSHLTESHQRQVAQRMISNVFGEKRAPT